MWDQEDSWLNSILKAVGPYFLGLFIFLVLLQGLGVYVLWKLYFFFMRLLGMPL